MNKTVAIHGITHIVEEPHPLKAGHAVYRLYYMVHGNLIPLYKGFDSCASAESWIEEKEAASASLKASLNPNL